MSLGMVRLPVVDFVFRPLLFDQGAMCPRITRGLGPVCKSRGCGGRLPCSKRAPKADLCVRRHPAFCPPVIFLRGVFDTGEAGRVAEGKVVNAAIGMLRPDLEVAFICGDAPRWFSRGQKETRLRELSCNG